MAKKGKILFDLGHNEDPLGLLVEELKKDGFICYTHRGLISSETLEPYTALFLAYPRKDFEEEEINAIVEFSRQGGNITITANPQTQKEYEIFIEDKGGLIKLLLNTGMMYKQLYPRIPLYAIKDNLQYVPLKEGSTPSDIGIPYSQLNFFPIDLWKKQLLEDVEEIFEERKTGFSYFYPVDKEKVLLKKWIDIGFPSLSGMGFNYERLDGKTKEIIDEAVKKERDELFNACVGLLNPMQEGIGRNLGFCGNFFADELIEQDKGKKANFRLITDLLKHCSEARLFVLPAEELKPEKIEVPIKSVQIKAKPLIAIPKYVKELENLESLLKQLATDALKNMPRGELLNIQDQIVSSLETILFDMRAKKMKEELDEEDREVLRSSFELQQQFKKPPSDEKLSELELKGIREYSYTFQNYINKTKREIGIPTNLSN